MTLADGLRGAALLARGRSEGLQRFADDEANVRRSVVAALLCLLLFAATRAIDWRVSGLPAHAWQSGLREALTFVIGWAGFALISHAVLGRVGLARRWPLYIVAWSWCNVVGNALVLLAAVPDLLHAPPMIGQALELIMVGWGIWLEWYAAVLTLDRNRSIATALVLTDFSVGLALSVLVAVLA